ncbi:MAG TPA: 1-acyl-sn-glycerol-3-phosphate acyltransferase [Bacteroidetes bacterium]|nr:1-acyl-sn-glycerol-3-phosphate acyltransferase [Bacteroidota bacterium]
MNIFRKIWAIYGITVFFILWTILMPFYLIAFLLFPKSWTKAIIWFSHHIYTRLFFTLILVRIKIEGLEYLDKKKTYIIVSNHLTALDFMVNARAYPGVYKYLAKIDLVKIPVFGFIVKKLCVLVDRKSRESRVKSIAYLRQTLKDGYSVFLYPEGTRNETDAPLLPFHKGAFSTAIESGCPVAVQTIVKIKHVSGKASGLDLFPGTIKVVWSKPISTEGMTNKDVLKLKEKVEAIMREQLVVDC